MKSGEILINVNEKSVSTGLISVHDIAKAIAILQFTAAQHFEIYADDLDSLVAKEGLLIFAGL